MPLKHINKKIGEYDIKINTIPGIESFKIKTQLFKLVGPSTIQTVTALVTSFMAAKSVLDVNIDTNAINHAVADLCERVHEDTTLALIFRMMSKSSLLVNEREMNEEYFNDVFSGNFSLLYKILGLIIQENYGDFFGAGGIGKKWKEMIEEGKKIMAKTQASAEPPQSDLSRD